MPVVVHRLRQARRRVLAVFAVLERPCAWGLLIGGAATFVSVAVGLIIVGDAKLATLLVAADLTVAGFGAVQEAEQPDDDGAAATVADDQGDAHGDQHPDTEDVDTRR
jgi:hypothetical protein